jgi:hypothetical protein
MIGFSCLLDSKDKNAKQKGIRTASMDVYRIAVALCNRYASFDSEETWTRLRKERM